MIRREVDLNNLSVSSTERSLLRAYGDQLCAGYFVRRLEGFIHNLNGPLQILWLRSEQVEKEIVEFQCACETGKIEESAEIAAKLGPRVESFIKAFGKLDDSLRFITKDVVGKCRGTPDPLSLNDVLADVFFLMKSDMFFKHRVDTRLVLSEQAAKVYGRHDHLCAIFLCLIQNALDAMVDASVRRLVVEVVPCDDSVTVNIEDSGSGVDEAVLDRLFDPFFTTKEGKAFDGGGMERRGIGLPLVALLVSDVKGALSLESVPGKTTFSVSFQNFTPPRD